MNDTAVQGGATAVQGIPMPRLGSPLADGRFAGIVYDAATNQDVALVDLGFSDEDMTHEAAGKWAAEKGAFRPTREEARVLWANLDSRATGAEVLRPGWFWLDPQYAGFESFAWLQLFDVGYQGYDHKSSVCRARAVRRFPLQPFSNSGAA
jgi:hypothetical protein